MKLEQLNLKGDHRTVGHTRADRLVKAYRQGPTRRQAAQIRRIPNQIVPRIAAAGRSTTSISDDGKGVDMLRPQDPQ
jgi:hypothetical protein